MRIEIRHRLSVTPPAGSPNAVLQLLLTPQDGTSQRIERWEIDVAGIENAEQFIDAYGNAAHLVNQARPEGELVVTVSGLVDTSDNHGIIGKPGGEPVPALYKRVTALTRSPVTLWGKYRTAKESRLEVMHVLMARVGETLGLTSDEAPAQSQTQMSADGSQSQSQGEIESKALPPAADFAHGFIGAARALDIPARYVTGYLLDAEGTAAFHAWAEAYDERLGWIGFDPLLQLCPTDHHVRLAVGLDALTTQPVRLAPVGEGPHGVDVRVERAQ